MIQRRVSCCQQGIFTVWLYQLLLDKIAFFYATAKLLCLSDCK
jgi:hypothetical protein